VRGIISKFGANLTMAVEMYETEDGNLVATSGLVRSENIAELLDKTAAVCTDMYKTFVASQRPAPKTPVTQTTPPEKPVTYTVTAAANPPHGGTVSRNPNQTYYAPGTSVTITATPANGYTFTGWSGSSTSANATLTGPVDRDLTLMANFSRQSVQPTARYTQETSAGQTVSRSGDYEADTERRPMTGFSLGWSFNSRDHDSHGAFQLGVVHSRPMSEKIVSLNIEGNIWMGEADYYSSGPDGGDIYDSFGLFGINAPVTALMQWGFFSLEAGVDADLLFGDDQTLFNAGFVVGAGVGFSKKHSRRYFYRYCGGYNLGTHVVGMWWLF